MLIADKEKEMRNKMTKTIETIKSEYSAIVLANVHTPSVEDIATVKAMYTEVMAIVPERLVSFVRPGFTGTIESEMAYTAKRWGTMATPAWHEYNAYLSVGYRVAHLITDTLGLRD